jgi:uroporphyrin-III C-methyltransferase
MAGRRLAALGRQLRAAGWEADTPVCVVSRAGCSDQLVSDHRVGTLAQAALLHAGRPTIVTVGTGARPVQQSAKSLTAVKATADAAAGEP